jgi:hypothetical protein
MNEVFKPFLRKFVLVGFFLIILWCIIKLWKTMFFMLVKFDRFYKINMLK